MNLVSAISSLELESADHYDLILLACGFESRSRYLAQSVLRFQSNRKNCLVWVFKNHSQDVAFPDNLRYFSSLSDVLNWYEPDEYHATSRTFEEALRNAAKDRDSIRVLVDYSSMTRTWYSSVVRCLASLDLNVRIVVDFCYSVAQFPDLITEYPPSEVVSPLLGSCSNSGPDKPTALVLSLGYHHGRGLGLHDYLDPGLTIPLMANPALDYRYVEAVKDANASLFEEIGNDVIEYSMYDPSGALLKIESLCIGLQRHWRVVLASTGPKLLGLIFLLIATRNKNVSVWRVSAGAKAPLEDIKAEGVIVLATCWQPFDSQQPVEVPRSDQSA